MSVCFPLEVMEMSLTMFKAQNYEILTHFRGNMQIHAGILFTFLFIYLF